MPLYFIHGQTERALLLVNSYLTIMGCYQLLNQRTSVAVHIANAIWKETLRVVKKKNIKEYILIKKYFRIIGQFL